MRDPGLTLTVHVDTSGVDDAAEALERRLTSDLTVRQRETLEAIVAHRRQHGYSPTVRDLCELLECASTNTVHGFVAALERKGYIRRTPGRARSIVLSEAWTLNVRHGTVVAEEQTACAASTTPT